MTRTRSPRSATRATGVSPETNNVTSAGNGRHDGPSRMRSAASVERARGGRPLQKSASVPSRHRRRRHGRRKLGVRPRRHGGRTRDPNGAREEPGARPERPEREPEGALPTPSAHRHRHRDARNHHERSGRGRAARRVGPGQRAPDQEDRRRRRRRTAAGEDGTDHAARSSETSASTRCVNAKRSKSAAVRIANPSARMAGRSRASVAGSHET